MRTWLIRVTACEAYLGNPNDPLYWHFTIKARTKNDAIECVRTDPGILSTMAVEASLL